MKKFLCAFIAILLFCGYAYADETVSQDSHVNHVTSYALQRDLGNASGFKTSDSLHIVWIGTYRVKTIEQNPSSPDVEVKPDEGLFTVFMVKSDKDTSLKLDILEGWDIRTNKFTYRAGEQDFGYA